MKQNIILAVIGILALIGVFSNINQTVTILCFVVIVLVIFYKIYRIFK
ncbi:hypothetical protein [Helicobacter sp. 13S00401-1]|nr:hypothetical protein [Helicobacter sp. 13S00401-1]